MIGVTTIKGNWSALQVSKLVIGVIVVLFAFSVAASERRGFRLDDYLGKTVVLDFWASWCVPCRHSFPWMNEIHEKYAAEGLVVIAVNLDNEAAEASEFLQRYPADFLIAYDEDRSLAHKFDVQVMPSSFVIGRDGKIVARHFGFKSAKTDEYEAVIVAALHSDHQAARTSQ